jgi:DNA polymerase/3'-5' exonuclease PolX
MILSKAQAIAEKVKAQLSPFCERVEIAGSIRREKPEVKDIELVCIPRLREMYGFVSIVNQWKKIKGEASGRYTQRLLPDGINLDLFIANEDNWGLIFAIRTGSAEYSHKVLATGWVKAGYHGDGGVLIDKDGISAAVREEKDLFDLIGVPFLQPQFRDI